MVALIANSTSFSTTQFVYNVTLVCTFSRTPLLLLIISSNTLPVYLIVNSLTDLIQITYRVEYVNFVAQIALCVTRIKAVLNVLLNKGTT